MEGSNTALAALLPQVKPNDNKYSRGRLQLVVGSPTYPGAACLAAVASQVAGAGYTEVFTAPTVVPVLQGYRASLVVRPFAQWNATPQRPSDARHPRAVVVGCGFDGADETAGELLARVLEEAACPVLVDGGALGFLAQGELRTMCLQRAEWGYPTILTPHGGEAAQLARGLDMPDEPEALAIGLARVFASVVALKGPNTFISGGAGIYRMTEGTAALAKAGTGDVLAGIVGAFLAQGVHAFDSCILGCTLHARSGNLAAADKGLACVCPEDLIAYLPAALRTLEE